MEANGKARPGSLAEPRRAKPKALVRDTGNHGWGGNAKPMEHLVEIGWWSRLRLTAGARSLLSASRLLRRAVDV